MNHEVEKRVGANVRALRIKAGLTQEALAAKLQLAGCDVTRSAIAKIEVGQRHLYPDEVILLQKILNTTFEEIFSIEV
ncbi:MAG: helix-turn-helix transcriptional regulator [Clostridia bacterium]|jgi:transcriptional regulator with XRE-family HTH domain|nr:helix-turn-helix transcriptional regulator [Clostridia bacterium]MBR6554393.1 helix-turn-helix transcriptional regulator [Clostridia bacterium]